MRILSLLLWSACLCMGILSCKPARQQESPTKPQKEFRLPDVPATLTHPEERAAYLCLHYWDHFDFADTSLIARPEITEQAFVNFINVLPYSPCAQEAVDTLVGRAWSSREMLDHFSLLGDKYLYEPNSPMHNEDLYILFLQAWVRHPGVDEVDKIRPRQRLEMAMKNRPGEVAADFTVTCRDGRRRQLSALRTDFVLLYFNDPDCDDCRRMKERLSRSAAINGLLKAGRLTLLSVCVEGRTSAWEKAVFPAAWLDGYDDGQRLTRDQVYDLKAMPTLYLLDAEKRVMLKDTSLEQVEERLYRMTEPKL